jgi:hypothetical protein
MYRSAAIGVNIFGVRKAQRRVLEEEVSQFERNGPTTAAPRRYKGPREEHPPAYTALSVRSDHEVLLIFVIA